MRFFSVMLFIGSGFMLLAAAGMLVAGCASALGGSKSAVPAGMFTGIAVAYAVFAIVYIYPALKLWKYADKIGRLLSSGREADLVEALRQQRRFWKFVGIGLVALVAIYILVIIVAVALGGFAAMNGSNM